VSGISELYARFRQLIHEGAKFLAIGTVGAIVTFGAANALHSIGPYKAITIATILATVITYLGNRYWTFRHREGKGTTRDSVLFFVLNGVGLIIYWGCIGVIDLAGLRKDLAWYNVALVVGTALGTLFRFWSYRKWIWLEKALPTTEARDGERAPILPAMAGAIPVGHHSMNGALANGASPNGASDPVTALGAHSGPHSHARPGRPSFRAAPDRPREHEDGNPSVSHRRTS
jgi:putative flippase GtrA